MSFDWGIWVNGRGLKTVPFGKEDFLLNGHFGYLYSFLFAFLLIDYLRRRALATGFVDRPSGRKRHRGEIPLVGGLGIFLSGLLSLLAFGLVLNEVFLSLFIAGGVVTLIGAMDDYGRLPPWPRLVAQILAALLLAVGFGVMIENLGVLWPGTAPVALGALAVPFTVFVVVGVINAFNMLDGADGLSGSVALVAIVAMGCIAYDQNQLAMLRLLMLLASGLLAFLLFNLRLPGTDRARVFLGDAGSMFVGFSMVWFMIGLSQPPQHSMAPVVAGWLLMVPLFDTVYQIIRRLVTGRSPFGADRRHLHHYFLSIGFTVNQTVVAIFALSIAGAAIGLAGHFLAVPQWLLAWGFIGAFGLYCAAMSWAWRRSPRLARRRGERLRRSVISS